MRPIERRIEKLERGSSGGVFVVSGNTEGDRRRQIDELIASGKAGPDSLFIHIRNLLDGETDEGAKLRKGSKP